jgi:hypothetical protein
MSRTRGRRIRQPRAARRAPDMPIRSGTRFRSRLLTDVAVEQICAPPRAAAAAPRSRLLKPPQSEITVCRNVTTSLRSEVSASGGGLVAELTAVRQPRMTESRPRG